MKKRAVMTVKWDVGAPAGFRGDAPAPCWADCPPHSMLPPPPSLAGPHLSRKHWPSTQRLLSSEVLRPHVWVSLRFLVPVFLRGGIPQGQKRAGEGNGPQGTRVALTFVLSTFHRE